MDPSVSEIGRNRGVSVGIVGDIGAVVDQLFQEAKGHIWPAEGLKPWLGQIRQDRESWVAQLESHAIDEIPLHPMRVFKEVERFAGDDTILIFDGGDYAQWGRSYLKARRLGHWMRLGPLSQLGCGLPLRPGRQAGPP